MRNPPQFNDYSAGPNFDRARIGIATPFQYLDIPLDTATENMMVDISGDFLYFDTADGYDGIITLELNNEHNAPLAPFTGRQGFALNALFKRLKLSWAAQPGKKVRIMYSTGERVIPALTGTLNVTGTVSTNEEPFVYGASYKSITLLLANTPETVFLPAANVNGAVIHKAEFVSRSASNNAGAGFLAKASAPATVIDGDAICSSRNHNTISADGLTSGWLEKEILIPAGKGLYFITNGAEASGASRSVLYTLL
jgi:hypothetical protein